MSLNFIDFLVQPLYNSLVKVVPSLAITLEYLKENRNYWASLQAAVNDKGASMKKDKNRLKRYVPVPKVVNKANSLPMKTNNIGFVDSNERSTQKSLSNTDSRKINEGVSFPKIR